MVWHFCWGVAGLGAEFRVGKEAGDWLVAAGGRGPVEVWLVTTTGLTEEERDRSDWEKTVFADNYQLICHTKHTSNHQGVCQVLPATGLVVEVVWAGCVSFSCRMELIKVVGERGVSTGATLPSRTGHTSTSGLNGSSLMFSDWLSLQVTRAVSEWHDWSDISVYTCKLISHPASVQSLTTSSSVGVATSVMSEMIGPEVTGESENRLAAAWKHKQRIICNLKRFLQQHNFHLNNSSINPNSSPTFLIN